MHYLVKWEIDIEADSPESAALEAREIQIDPESTATVFEVVQARGIPIAKTIDTSEL